MYSLFCGVALWKQRAYAPVKSVGFIPKKLTSSTLCTRISFLIANNAHHSSAHPAAVSTQNCLNYHLLITELYTVSTEPTTITTYINKG